MEVYAITQIDSRLYAAGRDFDADRTYESLPAMWVSDDGFTWERLTPGDAGELVPFTIIDFNNKSLGFWPPPNWPATEPVRVLTK